MQIAATGAQEVHIDGDGRRAFHGFAVTVLGNQQAALLVDQGRRVLDFLQFVIGLLDRELILRIACLVYVVIDGERADGDENHQYRHHDGADHRLLAFLFRLFGTRLDGRGFGGPPLGAALALLRVLVALGHPIPFPVIAAPCCCAP